MKKTEVKAKFNISYAGVVQLADKVLSLIQRDAQDLLLYGIDAQFQADMQTTKDTATNIKTDEEMRGEISIRTMKKDDLRKNTHILISDIMIRAKNIFGLNSPEYQRFGTKDINSASDIEFVKVARRVARIANEYLTQLSTKGLTLAMIQNLEASINDFDTAIDEKLKAENEQDITTQLRVTTLNKLYDFCTEVCDYGKTYYSTRDEAKYNDYLIHDGFGGIS